MKIRIRPREAFRRYLNRKERWACIVAHRRAGKTVAVIQDLLSRALTYKRKGPPTRYAYVAPTRDQAKDIAWGYLKSYVAKIPGIEINESDLRITLPNKSQIRLYSGDSYERMRGLYFDGIVIDEMADIAPKAWSQVMRPCLSDYSGWATFIGTPKGKNSFYKFHQQAENGDDWFSMVLRASESGLIPDDELADLRRNTPDDDFNQEYECDFSVGRPGAIYAADISRAESDGRIGPFPIDESALVHTTWDLGAPQNTVVIYWQRVGFTTRIIDCDSGLALKTGERVAHMMAKGYNYGKHFLPHDGQNLQADNMSFADKLTEAGLHNVVTLPRGPHNAEEKRIQAMTDMFSQIWFHERLRGEGGLIDALENYRRKENKLGGYVENVIVHDYASHYCFSPETEVITDKGVLPICELTTDHKVLTVTGWKHQTGGRITKRNQRVVEVELSTGRKVVCTPDHKWLTESGWISAENLTENTLLRSSSVNPRFISSVKELKQKIDVWCTTVPDAGHFALADGPIVKNCDSFGYWSEALKNRLIPEAHAMRSSKPAVQRAKIGVGNL